jgi:hypothetical protein
MDLYFQGKASLNKGVTPAFMAQARDFFVRALALDPGNIEAAVGAAQVDMAVGSSFMADHGAVHFEAAETALNKVLLQAPNHPAARCAQSGKPAFIWASRIFIRSSGERRPLFSRIVEPLQWGTMRRQSAITRRASSILPAPT